MRVALDTNRFTDLARGDRAVLEIVERANEVFLPFIVLAELRAGFLGGMRIKSNEELLRNFLGKENVSALFPDDGTTLQFAALFQQLRRQGTPIPEHDIWIAAVVLQHGLTLCTRDRHFDHLPQLMRI